MKKAISILLSLIMLLSIFTVVPMSVSADETRDFDYRVIGNNEAEITGYTGISAFIDIPSVINGLTVTSIGDWAFNGYGRMTELTIPDTVTNIGEGAFWECKGLTEVFIPASVTSISDSAFYDCTSLTRFKVDGNNPSYRSLNGDLYDKSASTLIQYASGKTKTSFTIPDSVVTIKEGAFIFSCLTEITVPKSVRNIDDYAIGYKYDDNHMPAPIDGFIIKGLAGTAAKLYATDNDITFVALESDPSSDYEYNVLNDGTAEITKYKGNGGDIEIPPTLDGYFVTIIGKKAFYDCIGLTKVTIPDSVMRIGYQAFYDCYKLTGVTIPDSVTTIGSCAFAYCYHLTRVIIPDSVTGIGDDTFNNCKNLTEVIIPDSVTSIGYRTFLGCNNLTGITIPNSVTSIGEDAFRYCNSLTYVTIPDSVTRIGYRAFLDCGSLTNITVDSNNPNYWSLDGNLYDKSGETLIQYAVGKTATSFTIPDSVITIGDYAFCGCSRLTEVTIPDYVTSIGDYALEGCSRLTDVTIPDSVTSIGNYAFRNCSKLTEVTIGNTVTNIGTEAFSCCRNLTEVTIPDSVTSIGTEAFSGCSKLTKVSIGNSVTTISSEMFGHCYSLSELIISNSVTTIDSEAFIGTENLKEVFIPDSVTSIGSCAFGYDSFYDEINGFTIFGYHGTVAEKYANDNGFTFIALEYPLLGDVDSDQVVGIIDTTYIQRYNAGFRIPVSEEDMLARGDVDGDEEVGVIDATYIQRYDAGFNVPYPIGEPIA